MLEHVHRSRGAVARPRNHVPPIPRRKRHGWFKIHLCKRIPLLLLHPQARRTLRLNACMRNPVAQVALGAMVDRDLSEPYSMFTYRENLSLYPCAALLQFLSLSLASLPTPPTHRSHSGVFIKTCPSISHLCFCNGDMIGCVVCKVTRLKTKESPRSEKKKRNPSSLCLISNTPSCSLSITRSCRAATLACCL